MLVEVGEKRAKGSIPGPVVDRRVALSFLWDRDGDAHERVTAFRRQPLGALAARVGSGAP